MAAATMDAPPADPRAPSEAARSSWLARVAHPLAWLVAAAFLFPMLGKSGIWDPYELDAAELARRIAVNVWGAPSLALEGAVNTLPTLTDLGMGELPFTSMALGFRAFGLHDWSGRLPLALWAFAGAMALYHLVARLVDRRAGLYATAALVTMPLYFMQARTMLGDVVTMAALAMAFAGLVGAMLDDRCKTLGRVVWLAVAAVGLAAGFFSRGALIGVAVPALSAGLAWVVVRLAPGDATAGRTSHSRFEAGVGALSLVLAACAIYAGVTAILHASKGDPLARVIGFEVLARVPSEATFDLTIRTLGHSLFPWSAFIPFAIGRLFAAPRAEGAAARRETSLRVALLVGASVCFAAFALVAPLAGALPFSGAPLLAAIAAVAIFDFERDEQPSRALALGVVLLGFVLYADMTRTPDKALSVFSVDKAVFPKSFEEASATAMWAVLALFAVVSFGWLERQPADLARGVGAVARRRAEEYRLVIGEVAAAWSGNLVFALIVVEAALVGLGAMLFFGARAGWGAVETLPKNFVDAGVNVWWVAPVGLAAALPAAFVGRDAFSFLVHLSRLSRAGFAMLGALAAASLQSFFYYPALAEQLSPKDVFESYQRLAPGAPLGLLNMQSRVGAYYDAGALTTFTEPSRAFRWLIEDGDERRWLVVKAEDLPRLNALYRKDRKRNLPVLDGRSSQILLVSSELAGAKSESWLDPVVLDEPPAPARPLDAAFEDQLEVLGWEVRDAEGAIVTSVVPQTRYQMRLYYRVMRPITGTWKSFIHIDGFQRRFNGDHTVLDGKYPMNLWQEGDVIVDDYPFELEPNFTPGDYTLFFGFFTGDTRFHVTRGPHQDDRVIGGPLQVR